MLEIPDEDDAGADAGAGEGEGEDSLGPLFPSSLPPSLLVVMTFCKLFELAFAQVESA